MMPSLTAASAACLLGAAAAGYAPATFTHPGVLWDAPQIAYVKQAVAAGTQPEAETFAKAQSYWPLQHGPYKPQGPPASGVIECGSYSHPDYGCTFEGNDGEAAVTLAYLWALTGNVSYAENAIEVLNAYAYKLNKYNNSNGPLQSAWGAVKWAKAAELLAHTGAPYAAADQQAMVDMLYRASIPAMGANGTRDANGNWQLVQTEAMMSIAVLSENATLFDHAVSLWLGRVPAYFYLAEADGGHPREVEDFLPFWFNQVVFNASVDGVCQETCRDFGHTSFGIASTFNVLETARIQGVDLLSAQPSLMMPQRLAAALEFHAHILRTNTTYTPLVCNGTKLSLALAPTFQVGYANMALRSGAALPWTLAHLQSDVWPMAVPAEMFMTQWEPLTHGGIPPAGVF